MPIKSGVAPPLLSWADLEHITQHIAPLDTRQRVRMLQFAGQPDVNITYVQHFCTSHHDHLVNSVDASFFRNPDMIRWNVIAVAVILAVFIGNRVTADEPQKEGAEDSVGHYAEVNGIKMYYEIHGEGEPLVLLHGFLGSTLDWKEYLQDFAKHYQLIIPDLRGHGRSTNPTNQFTHRQAALDMHALLDHLKIDTFQGMGISSGGMTLIHMATQQPERAEAIVLIGATIYFPKQARSIQETADFDKMPPDELEYLRSMHKHGDDQIKALFRQFHAFHKSYDDMNFTPPYLSTIQARTFIIHGDRDAHFPVNIPVEMYRSIPRSYLWIIPNGGHVPISGKEQATFTEKSLEFLKGEWESNNAPR